MECTCKVLLFRVYISIGLLLIQFRISEEQLVMQTDKTESSKRRRQRPRRQRGDRRLLMGSAERLIEFLERCVSRGVGSGNESLPTLRELSKLCECEASTLSRIRSGDTTSTDRR
ncbi:hypothetical protein Pla22_42320 [Rubripirellula amarantea]|uniref:Uncharacterized protein n=1 Tax=Rubripirellula amarantea TaxID=2527999 RepID=A0A5C5WKZ9_9BACT|nr:hypothetical protein Pla22_42320 [Rubripirellula amarantea]